MSSNYLDCPKCGMKYHKKALTCPKCNITPEQFEAKRARSEAAALQYREEKEANRAKKAAAQERARLTYCTACGSTFEKAKRVTKGSLGIEILLWLFLLIPGVLYSVWRHTTRYRACPICEAANIIPANSPKAEQGLSKG